MKIRNLKNLLIIVFVIILMAVFAGCAKDGTTQTTDSAAAEEFETWPIDDETIDPSELSDYVDDYVIDVQEDEIVIIN